MDAFHSFQALRHSRCPISALALELFQPEELIVAIRRLAFRGALVHAALPAE